MTWDKDAAFQLLVSLTEDSKSPSDLCPLPSPKQSSAGGWKLHTVFSVHQRHWLTYNPFPNVSGVWPSTQKGLGMWSPSIEIGEISVA